MTAQMKTRSTPSLVLILIALGAWALLLAEVFADFLGHHAFITAVAAAGIATACSTALHIARRLETAIGSHAGRMEQSVGAHAGRFEQAVDCHKAAMKDLSIERFFELGMVSDRIAETQADGLSAPVGRGDTGPLPIYKRQ